MFFHRRFSQILVIMTLSFFAGSSFLGSAAIAKEPLPQACLSPERIILNLTETPAISQAVTWRTAYKVKKPIAQITRATGSSAFMARQVTISATSEEVQLDDSTHIFSHSAVFKGLEPKTLYAYRVGDKDNWSEWNQFKTAGAGSEPFTFVYFGDPQKEIKSICSRTFRAAYKAAPEAAFWHFTGDLVDNGDKDKEWEELFYALGFIPRTTPMILLPGNHEYPDKRVIKGAAFQVSSLWRPQFTLPKNGPEGLGETAYFIDYQGVRFIMLNGNEKLEEQAEWLKKILANNPQKWTIAAIHQPIYSTGKKRNDLHLQKLLVPVFDRFSVDLVLQGHDHTYARTKRLVNNKQAIDPNQGTVYITSVSGPKSYPVSHFYDHLMEKIGTGLQLFQIIRVDGKRLTFEAFDSVGNSYDRFELNK